MAKRYWLMKSEPEVFSIDDLAAAPGQTTVWEGVRNFQARNFLRDDIQQGDLVVYYHSNAKPPAAVGVAEVARAGYADPSQFNKQSKYFDEKSSKENPRWFVVDLRFRSKFKRAVPLDEIRRHPVLQNMVLVKRGRLSVQPVAAGEYAAITKLATGKTG